MGGRAKNNFYINLKLSILSFIVSQLIVLNASIEGLFFPEAVSMTAFWLYNGVIEME
jgi:hypothetical protein